MERTDQLKHRTTAKVLEQYIFILRKWILLSLHQPTVQYEEVLTDLRGYYLGRKDGSPEILLMAEQKCIKDLPVPVTDDQLNGILIKMVAQAARSMELYGTYLDLND